MSETPSEHSDHAIVPVADANAGHERDTERAGGLQHVTVDPGDEIAVCTMYPPDLEEEEMGSTWLTAIGDAFVSLEDAR